MKSHRQLEDSSSQAGWMFADLFLALTVIFLATVSFIPAGSNGVKENLQNMGDNSSNNNASNRSLTLISNGFIGEYEAESTSKFLSDLKNYLELKSLSENTTALYLEVNGNTNKLGSSNDDGNLDALKFVIKLRKDLPTILNGTNTSINVSPDVMPGRVKVKITFI